MIIYNKINYIYKYIYKQKYICKKLLENNNNNNKKKIFLFFYLIFIYFFYFFSINCSIYSLHNFLNKLKNH